MNEDIKQQLQLALSHHQAGRLQDAEEIYQSILRTDPQQADAWHLLGVLAHQVGRNELAVQSIEKAINIDPRNPDFHNNCGEAYRALKKFDLAVSHYQQALLCKPDFAGAQMNLGNAMKEQGRLEDAARYYRQALENDADFFMAHNNLGIVLREMGRPEEAVSQYRRAVKLMPDYAEALNNLGNALCDLERMDEAISAYRTAIEKMPSYPDALSNLGNALYKTGSYEEARTQLEKAVAINPGFAMAWYNLGITLDELGEPENAITAYRRAIEADQGDAAAWHNLGFSLQELGRGEEALSAYKRAIELKPHYPSAHLHLSMIKPGPENRESIEKALNTPELSPEDEALYHFALGNIHHAVQDYNRAFVHWKRGNALKRSTFRYRPEDFSSHVDRLIARFGADFFAARKNLGSGSKRPVFIIGLPRSGSTLVEQILSSHPQVHGAGELTIMEQVENDIRQKYEQDEAYPECVDKIDAAAADGYAGHYLETSNSYAGNARHVTDKDPGNFHRLGLVHLLFPEAAIIHCRRTPLDTCLSIYSQFFAHGNIYSFELEELGRYYLDYQRLMEHWSNVIPGKILNVSYEDFVTDQENTTRKMLAYLGLDWDPACLDFHKNTRAVRTASSVQVRRPMYRESLQRWKCYQEQLAPLVALLGRPD